MKALERLTAYLCSAPDTEKLDAYHAVVAQQILDQHAHELAEKIRTSPRLRDYTDNHMGDCNLAADLIDPELRGD